MKTRRTKALPQTTDDKGIEGQRSIYVSLETFEKFINLRDSSELGSDQLLGKLIDVFLAAETSQESQIDRPQDRNESVTIKRKLQRKEEVGLPSSRKRYVKPKKLSRGTQNVDTTNKILNSPYKSSDDTKYHKPEVFKSKKLLPTSIVEQESGTSKDHVVTNKRTGKPDFEQDQTLAPIPSELNNDNFTSCNTDLAKCIKPEVVPETKDSESPEHQQSQIALVLLSMSQAPAKPDPTDKTTRDDLILTELPESKQIEDDQMHTKAARIEVKGANSKVETKTFSCEQCPYQTNKRGDLKTHNRIHTGVRPYSCKECGASFRQRHHLNYHELTHSNSLNFKCSVCPKSFRTTSKLRLHMKTHPHIPQVSCLHGKTSTSKQNMFKCDQCNYQAPTASDLKKHSSTHSEKNLKCEFCDFTTSWKKNLRIHRMRHTGEKPYTCGDCDFSTYDSHALRRHRVNVHSTDQAFVCEVCGSSFAQNKLLLQHQVVHTGEKPYKCPHCDYSAGYRSNLRSHLLMHNPKKGFVCEDCGKDFRQKQHLSSHQKNKHSDPNKVYLCQICGYSTTASQSLNSHMRVHSANRRAAKQKPNMNYMDVGQTQKELESSQNMATVPTITTEISDLITTNTKPDEQLSASKFQDDGFVKEHSYSTHLEQPISDTTDNNGLTPAQVQLYAIEANQTNPEPSATDSLSLAVGSQLLQAMVREGDMAGLADQLTLQEGPGGQQGLDPGVGVCGSGQGLGGPAVHDSIVYDQQGNPLFQYDQGMAAVLSHIIPDFNYQP